MTTMHILKDTPVHCMSCLHAPTVSYNHADNNIPSRVAAVIVYIAIHYQKNFSKPH